MSGAPAFSYYNVAVAAPDNAIELATKHLAKAGNKDGELRVVRGLSAAEISALSLRNGDIKPA